MQTHKQRLRALARAARAAAELAEAAREARDAAIEQAELGSLSVREIAEATELSPARVQSIVIRRTAERQARQRRALGVDGPVQGPVG